MRRTLLIILGLLTLCNAMAQKYLSENVETEGSINVALNEVNKKFVPAPARNIELKSGSMDKAHINVNYNNFPEDAKKAFQYAISIWEDLIYSPVTINIEANWEKLNGNVLAISKPSQFYQNFDGAIYRNVYYPVALAEKLMGEEITGANQPDIVCTFNKEISWYLGTDGNTPGSSYDLVTAVLHEITHGLGFSGFYKTDNSNGYFNNNNNLPSIYDYYIFNYNKLRLAEDTNFPRPSNQLFSQLTSQKLKFYSNNTGSNFESCVNTIYAPSTWKEGSSIYHLNETDFHSDEKNALMTAYKYKGEAVHNPGQVALEILSDLGWKTTTFQFEEIKDFEEPCAELPLEIKIMSDSKIDESSVKVIFSTNYFTSKDSSVLHFDSSKQSYVGSIQLNQFMGNLQYYFQVSDVNNKVYRLPSLAPGKKFCLRIGPDYSPPSVQHNPVKLISRYSNQMQLTAIAEDNLGVNSVMVEYKLNGQQQEPVSLDTNSKNVFSGNVDFPQQLFQNDKLEYRIVARDESKNGNKIAVPATGYFSVNVFESVAPVSYYQTDFNSGSDDFLTADFEVSTPAGFSNGILSTSHPYPTSALENENYECVAQLKYPIVLQPDGQMTFSEIVLVEPGEPEASYTDNLFWDYVIVEGSKDNGKTWQPLTVGYDSQSNDNWYAAYTNTLKSTSSSATGNNDMFVEHTINLTENTGFYAGDTVLFRFRLSSDKSVNGWGWAIDNLEIQKLTTAIDENLLALEEVNVYPNPFTNNFYIDYSNVSDVSNVDITVTDLAGKTVHQEVWSDTQFNPKKQVDLANIQPGIYLVNMTTEGSFQRITKKIIKH